MRCSDEIGVAGRLGGGLVAAGARARVGLGLLAVLAGFALLAVDRRVGLFAVLFAVFFRVVAVFPRAALPTVRFLRVALALPLTFFLAFLVAIATSLTHFKIFARTLPNDRIAQRPTFVGFPAHSPQRLSLPDR
jgi:hypothetical protein